MRPGNGVTLEFAFLAPCFHGAHPVLAPFLHPLLLFKSKILSLNFSLPSLLLDFPLQFVGLLT
ncbi:hypothetical protein H490_0103835 [Leucobacter sp. UCD-THU]|nr:hypothetical protein H490_0103835 [Leucobacter sp. UCD-THU]